jgi:hypothetical protein
METQGAQEAQFDHTIHPAIVLDGHDERRAGLALAQRRIDLEVVEGQLVERH